MSVYILPSELGFRRPFTVEVSETLTIKNTTASPIAFKVKTTAPKQYCVRPNSGRIEPDRSVEVSVLLQAMKQDPPADYKCRDKFLVQSVPITGDKEFLSVQEIWDNVEKPAIQEKKIRVNFLPVEGAEAGALTPQRSVPVASSGDATPDVPPPAYSSPNEETSGSSAFPALDMVTPDGKSAGKRSLEPLSTPPTGIEASSSSFTAVGASTGASSTESKDATIASLRAKLAEANALIVSLQDGGLRQRKLVNAASPSENPVEKGAVAPQLQQVARQGTEGVPVQIAALLSLFSFLLAYFFF